MLGCLPKTWGSVPLCQLTVFALGGDWGKSADHDDPVYVCVRCIRASELRNWDSEHGSTAALRKVKKSSLASRELRSGDIIVEVSGGGPEQPVGRTALINSTVLSKNPEHPKICTNFFRLLRPSDEMDSDFLNSYLRFFYKAGKTSAYQGGSNNLRNLKFNDYLTIRVPIPPAVEQRRIVTKIEELFSELDKGIESLKTAREQLNVYRQAVLKHAFEGKLTAQWREMHSASPWCPTTLGSQLSFLTSGSRGWAKYYAPQGDKFIRAQNLTHDQLDLQNLVYVDLPEKSEGMRTLVQKGDLLITITGANVTKTAFVESDIGTSYVSQHVALARPVEGSNTKFLYWYLVSEAAGRKQLTAHAYGAGKPGLNLENIRSVKILLPSPEEQSEIVSRLDAILSIERGVIAQINAEIARSDSLRETILRKAFSGELVEQDPNDEPAAALLKRIKAEKASQTPKRRTRKRKKVANA